MSSFAERFLVHPDLFPARLAGEPWGDRELGVELAGESCRLSGLSESQQRSLSRRFAGFTSTGSDAAAELRLFRIDWRELHSPDTRGLELTLELDPAPESLRAAGLHVLARVEWRAAPAAGLWTPHEGEACAGACENLLRLLAAYRLLERGGLLLHSAGIVDGDRAHVFLGRSGAGKTTLAHLSVAEGRSVLSDDLNAVLPGAQGPVAWAMPFAGDMRADAASLPRPLDGLYRLRQASGHAREREPRASMLAAAVACAPYVNRDPHRLGALLRAAAALVDSVPGYRLAFARDDGVWRTLQR
jgi:hypothetical protein